MVKGGQYHIRWFTPVSEVDLCGHATLAAAYALFVLILAPELRRGLFDRLPGRRNGVSAPAPLLAVVAVTVLNVTSALTGAVRWKSSAGGGELWDGGGWLDLFICMFLLLLFYFFFQKSKNKKQCFPHIGPGSLLMKILVYKYNFFNRCRFKNPALRVFGA